MKLTSKDFFFCYNYNLNNHLQKEGHKYITKGVNPENSKLYFMYQRTPDLSDSLNSYKK